MYIGSTYDEAIPAPFLDDVLASSKPVTWIGFNIWQLTNRWQALHPTTTFATQCGWMWSHLNTEVIGTVEYKATALRRLRANTAPLMNFSACSPTVPVAYAARDDGTMFPWALRSRQLTYIEDLPRTVYRAALRQGAEFAGRPIYGRAQPLQLRARRFNGTGEPRQHATRVTPDVDYERMHRGSRPDVVSLEGMWRFALVALALTITVTDNRHP